MAVKKRKKALSSGRPPVVTKLQNAKSMTSKTSRTIINTHHRLQKEKAIAIKAGDIPKAEQIEKQIEVNGGLKTYQAASIQGQAATRGGDSSKLLVQWLQEAGIIKKKAEKTALPQSVFRVLEVGALSTTNEISKYPQIMDVTRIDLNSQAPGIQQQDFMERPLPKGPEEMFDIISLSLVLNYVPTPHGRGDMLRRLCHFLRCQTDGSKGENGVLPALFFVLPLHCVTNSRYMDEERLMEIMASLGFVLCQRKTSLKLCYYLYRWNGKSSGTKWPRKQVRNGPGMNNFCIILK
ncbi:hypothetical protein GQ43DRAFT_459624 [Delitschia confertaspora ATCC 74209]|uniref:25S rRNA adenine-N(1) methyltransferase n=1 Tax=Delitschia confertaspora ATCC 74209 TaxID=1513339 RepID=A0A9P4JV85_9PLEO|nr:hypothetical protein GQ43DRAFT_459624 [Delitschia confertaspora ATCC 74209]